VVEENTDKVLEKAGVRGFDGNQINAEDVVDRPDGIATLGQQQKVSFVNHFAFKAPKTYQELNEIILSLYFEDADEQYEFADAFTWAYDKHADKSMRLIFTTALAKSAGVKFGRPRMAVEAITHTTQNFSGLNQDQQKRGHPNSPIGDH